MFTAALFTTARTWKQPKCLSTEEQIKNVWYNTILLGHKKNKIMIFAATWLDPKTVRLSDLSQRKVNIIQHSSYVEFKKIAHMNLFTK